MNSGLPNHQLVFALMAELGFPVDRRHSIEADMAHVADALEELKRGRDALRELVETKAMKEAGGDPVAYRTRREAAWAAAHAVLELRSG